MAGTAAAVVLLVSLYNIFLPQVDNENTPIGSYETSKKVFNPDPVSHNFHETMRLSSTLLEKLKIEKWQNIIENRYKAKSATTTQNSDLAGLPEAKIENNTPSPSPSINSQVSGIEKTR